jgi:hypothetical protein
MKKTQIFLAAALVLFVAAFVGAQPPGTPILHLRADLGVQTDGTGLTVWEDQSPTGNDAIRVDNAFGTPTMAPATRTFTAGERDVIRFSQPDGFLALDHTSLDLTEMTLYIVTEDADVARRRQYFSNYTNTINWGWGYAFGIDSDPSIGGPDVRIVRDFTSNGTPPPGHSDSNLGNGNVPPRDTMTAITHTMSESAGVKETYFNNVFVGSNTIAPGGIAYDTMNPGAQAASIGGLGQLQNGFFYYQGDIAEVIVYDAAHGADDRAAVQGYLDARYFVPEPGALVLLAVGIVGCGRLLRRRA